MEAKVGLKGIWNVWKYTKLKDSIMKIPQTKYTAPLTKFDVPLLFTKMNSKGQHIIFSEDPLFITGSSAK